MNLNLSISMGATAVVNGFGLPYAAWADCGSNTAVENSRFADLSYADGVGITLINKGCP